MRLLELIHFTSAAILIFITLATLCVQFARKRSRYMGPMILAWAAIMAMTAFKTIHIWYHPSSAYEMDIWSYLETLAAIIAGFTTIILVDSLSRESVEPIKLSLFSCWVGTSLWVAFTNPSLGQYFFIIGIQAMFGMIWFGYCVQIYRSAPKSLKAYAGLNLFGSCSVFGAIGSGISGLSNTYPGIEWVIVSLGYLLTTIAFIKREQLAFLLPFRVLRLTVVHLDGGIPMFNYTWKSGRDLIDEDLFSGIMHGLRLILRESVLRGEFRDINLDLASIIVQRVKGYPVMVILVSKKTSRVLRQALSTFTERFMAKYQQAISKPSDSSQFEGATSLVKEVFNFLPDFD